MTNPEPIRLPLLLDGEIENYLTENGFDNALITEEWLINNPESLKNIQSRYVMAGCDILSAPTENCNRVVLSRCDKALMTEEYNERLVRLTKQNASENTLVAGVIGPTKEYIEPLGNISFSEAIDIFLQQATAQKEGGADLFIIKGIDSHSELRAAVIACAKLKLPIFVIITVDRFGRTSTDSTILSYLIPLQEMKISAFGVTGPCKISELSSIVKEISRYSKKPLIAIPSAHFVADEDDFFLSPYKFAEKTRLLLESGAKIIGGVSDFSPSYTEELRKIIDRFDFSSVKTEKEDISLLLSNWKQVFFLSPDHIEISEPVTSEFDMADVLLDISQTSVDVICVDIETADDAYQFAQNSHMAKLPIMFHSDDEKVLKLALLSYHGRAMVDSKCDIDPEILAKVAAKYGAVVY